MTAPLIDLIQVEKVYHTPAGGFPALRGVNLQVQAGEFVGVLGKSGAGKTTLVNMITGVDTLTGGSVRVGGVDVHHMNESQMALWRGRNVGVVYQSFELMPNLSLLDNILLPMDFCGLYRPRASRSRALELLKMVELEAHASKRPAAISGGQQQRVAIARALANDPPLLVADEPTGRLDSLTAAAVMEVFAGLVRQGKTILMVTHDASLARWMSRTVTLADGRLVEAQA